jgi:hypothetical protein
MVDQVDDELLRYIEKLGERPDWYYPRWSQWFLRKLSVYRSYGVPDEWWIPKSVENIIDTLPESVRKVYYEGKEAPYPKGIPPRLGPWIDYITKTLKAITGILYVFEIAVFTGFIYEEAAQIYARLTLKYLCPRATGRLAMEFYPRLGQVSSELRAAVSLPDAAWYPGARALMKYAEAVDRLIWAVEQICEKEGVRLDMLWYEGDPVKALEETEAVDSETYRRELERAIELYEKMFGEPPRGR